VKGAQGAQAHLTSFSDGTESGLRSPGDANFSGFEDCETALQPLPQLFYRFYYGQRFHRPGSRVKPYIDHARGACTVRINQFAEIAIFRDQHTILTRGTVHHLVVGRARCNLTNSEDIMTGLTQGSDYRPCAAFIG